MTAASSILDYDPERDGPLLRTREVADLAHVSPKTITRWASDAPDGGLYDPATGTRAVMPTVRTAGRHRRYPRNWVVQYMLETSGTERLSGAAADRHQARLEREAADAG